MKTASTLFVNTLAQLTAKAFTTGSTLIITYLLAQKYGATGLGEFIAATSYVALFYLLTDFGINAVFTKRVKSDDTEARADSLSDYFQNLLSLRLVMGVVVVFVAVATLAFLNYPATVKVGVIIASLLILNQALFVTASAIFQVKLKYHLAAIAEIIGSAVTIMLVVLFLKANLGVLFIISAYVVGSVIRSALSLSFAKNQVGNLGLEANTTLWRSLISASLPLGMMAIFSQVVANIDKVLLALLPLPAEMAGDNIKAVAVYGLAYKFFDVSLVLPTYVMNAAFPIFVQTLQEDKAKLLGMAKKVGGVLFGVALVITIVGYFLSPWVIGVFSKNGELDEATNALRILLAGLPLFYLSAFLVWLAVALNKQKYLAVIYFLAALTNLTLNLLLIPKFGFYASSWLTLATELIIIGGVGYILLSWVGDKKAIDP